MQRSRHTATLTASLLLAALLGLVGVLPRAGAVELNPDGSRRAKPLVLCWYMVCFGASVEVYKQEIELAQRNGIDGFVLDVGQWKTGAADDLKASNYVGWADGLYQAAKELGTDFKLVMAPEYSVQPFGPNLKDMVLRYKDHPNQLYQDGKPVISGYCNPSMFKHGLDLLKEAGVEPLLVPHIFLPRYIYNPSMESFLNEFEKHPELDGLMNFNAVSLHNTLGTNAVTRKATQRLGKIQAAGVIPAYNSANLQDYRGLSGYLSMWEGAIADGSDWISIVIWNDYNEDSALMPSRWPSGSERHLYSRDESFLIATDYASAWFKSGVRPAITQDLLFITYRNRSKWERRAWNGKEWVDVSLANGRFDQIHDDVQDLVYIDTFLTAPGTVQVDLAGKSTRFELPAGVGHAELPMQPGVPIATLIRDGKPLAEVVGRRAIIDTPTERDSFVSYHHLNRTWAAGTAIGPVARHLEAEAGTLAEGAEVVTVGDRKAVRNTETNGSGFRVPVEGLATGTYNVRITYSNPSAIDNRLTLVSDGPPRRKGEYPYFIPAHLPPTGDGVFRTASFLWSLYDTTTGLSLEWRESRMWNIPQPEDYDYGTPLIDSIELIKVEGFTAPAATVGPDLVAIPAGEFTMGSTAGEPDEAPVHPVAISAFAIGRTEVTNAEFERFDPKHRSFRNGNSWRDSEPVMHVGWVDGAKYCNWLSEQHGLKPVYSELPIDAAKPNGPKAWFADFTADGFYLPTEAQWEYVATGRGEGRRYPWGNEAPVAGLQGRFTLDQHQGAHLPRPATEAEGVVAVGSYPAGASRDGVLDLAGNVAEWCTDWYAWYPQDAAKQTDPCNQTPSNYRAIRGGSWSWYAGSQRATDREFNSQNYPGHAYYGLRIAVSAAGHAKLKR